MEQVAVVFTTDHIMADITISFSNELSVEQWNEVWDWIAEDTSRYGDVDVPKDFNEFYSIYVPYFMDHIGLFLNGTLEAVGVIEYDNELHGFFKPNTEYPITRAKYMRNCLLPYFDKYQKTVKGILKDNHKAKKLAKFLGLIEEN